MRLSRAALPQLAPEAAAPGYDPWARGTGIVHLGLGAFHKAHQAVYTDDALAAAGGDWRIAGVSLRSTAPAAALAAQDGLFTVIARDAAGSRARVVGALAQALSLARDRAAVLAALTAPATRVVTLTVTEKGYGLDRAAGDIDPEHPAIAADLRSPEAPVGVAGLLVLALGRRRASGLPPFTVLCCDNLPGNGTLMRGLLTGFARRAAPELAGHVAAEVAFPSCMVDRITPAATDATRALARELTGLEDAAAVEAEAFRHWVIEDDFPQGRPAWEAGGAEFVADVAPHEAMKLRMLNGAHSMLAYAGALAGHATVRAVMADPDLALLVRRHMQAAAATLPAGAGLDTEGYAAALMARFANPHLAHETRQIAMDGSEKLPQRILAPAAETLRAGGDLAPFAFAVAAWMRWCMGRDDAGTLHELQDPRADALAAAAGTASGAAAVSDALHRVAGIFPDALRDSRDWRGAVEAALDAMLRQGMRGAVAAAAAQQRQLS